MTIPLASPAAHILPVPGSSTGTTSAVLKFTIYLISARHVSSLALHRLQPALEHAFDHHGKLLQVGFRFTGVKYSR